jgi:3-isopropylmalate dehydrogenase
MLCQHLGLPAEVARIEQAVSDDLLERPGAWSPRSMAEVGDGIAERGAS